MASAMFEDISHSEGENAATQEDTTKNVLALAYAGECSAPTRNAFLTDSHALNLAGIDTVSLVL